MSLREPQSVGAGCPTKNHTSVHLGSLGTLCSRHDFCDGQAISLREPHSVGTESPTKDHRSEYEGSSNIRIMTTYVVFLIATRIGHATPHSHEAPEGINKRNFHILQYGLVNVYLHDSTFKIQTQHKDRTSMRMFFNTLG